MLESLEVATIGGKIQMIRIKKDDGFAEVELRAIKLKALFQSKKSSEGIAFVLYEPGSGLFWRDFLWGKDEQAVMSEFLKEYRLFLLHDKIVSFRTHHAALLVLEGGEHQPSLDEAARNTIADIKPNLHENHISIQDPTVIYLEDLLGIHFCNEKMRANSYKTPHVTDVSRQKSRWIINLEGPNENKALGGSVKDKAEVILSDDYTVQEASVNGKKVYPAGR